jgi:hypothetical protein
MLNKKNTIHAQSGTENLEKKPNKKEEAWIKRLLNAVRSEFSKVPDTGKDRRKKSEKTKKQIQIIHNESSKRISITDCLMSGLAVFGMKCSSLLQFDERKNEEAIKHNLQTFYQIQKVPGDTYLRERLDEVDYKELRRPFKKIFSIIQRNKKLEDYVYLDEGYIWSVDGTGYFSSHNVHCNNCCTKKHSDGSVTYYHQSLQTAIVHPEKNIVIPFCPEPILKEDGMEKNDCELNAAKRCFENVRREHPHLKLVVTTDAIGANGPYIQSIVDNEMSFVILVKPSGNKSLFNFISGINLEKYEFTKNDTKYVFEFVNSVPLNDKYPDLLVNYFFCEEKNLQTGETKQCSWVTNIKITARKEP